ncbi:MAG: CHAD domain-containing protein, partial [Synechocystis sp.]|nr:CHAD domain-containing protein [Synechocystis sp.]
PEDLHQLRVGMRRLRSAIAGFGMAVELPDSITEKKIGAMARVLGGQRDNDVLQEILAERYYPYLPEAEQKPLNRVIKQLKKDRKQAFKATRKLLTQGKFIEFKHQWETWLAAPQISPIGELPIAPLLPDLLLPQLSQFFLHPGWLIGTEIDTENTHGLGRRCLDLSAMVIQTQLNNQEKTLHDLRKVAKRTRYQMELFSDCYSDDYQQLLNQVKQVQEILGNLQDSFVLRQLIEDYLDVDLARLSPQLDAIFQGDRRQCWAQWQSIQTQLIDSNYRQHCRQLINQISG